MVCAVCEGCQSLDVRQLHRRDRLRPGMRFDWSWTQDTEPAGSISIETEQDALVLIYRFRPFSWTEWRDVRQRVRITWTECHFGGRRAWFACCLCRRRVAVLYHARDAFACRVCCNLAYASQQEPVHHRGLARARKIRTRLGAGVNVMAPLPTKPKGMHWRTYDRLCRIHDHAVARSLLRLARFKR
jgi:hypothetical protein